VSAPGSSKVPRPVMVLVHIHRGYVRGPAEREAILDGPLWEAP
jgi:hypothetical protein